MDSQYGLKSISDYHHTVTEKATPSVEFTRWCMPDENAGMELPDYPTIRRANLKRFIELELDGNNSALARLYNPENPKPSYISDLLRKGSEKSFAGTAARQIEAAVGLLQGQLDIPHSPLILAPDAPIKVEKEISETLASLSPLEKRQALVALREIKGPREPRKRA